MKTNYNDRICFYVIDADGNGIADEIMQELGYSYNEFYTMAAACTAAKKASKIVDGDISVTVAISAPIFNNGKIIEE